MIPSDIYANPNTGYSCDTYMHAVKAYYFMKVGLVDLSTHGGKIYRVRQ